MWAYRHKRIRHVARALPYPTSRASQTMRIVSGAKAPTIRCRPLYEEEDGRPVATTAAALWR